MKQSIGPSHRPKTCCMNRCVALMLFICCFSASAFGDERIDVDPSQPGRAILHVCEIDGTPIRPLVNDVELRNRLNRQGTPDVSPDGSKVAFDAWSFSGNFDWQESRIIVVDFDGNNATDLGDGVMPSFSSDGKRLVFSRPPKYGKAEGAKGQSIWVMDVDGSNKEMIADRGAWGASWTSDGRTLVFHGGIDETKNRLPKTCLRAYDIESKQTRLVFSPDESPVSEMTFHFRCSQNDRRVVFSGPLKGGSPATMVIDIDQGINTLQVYSESPPGIRVHHGTTCDWHPDGTALFTVAVSNGQVIPHAIHLDPQPKPQTFDGFPKNVHCGDLAVAADGKHLVLAFRARPVN